MCPRVADASDAGRLIEGTRPLGRPFLDRDATLGRVRHGERAAGAVQRRCSRAKGIFLNARECEFPAMSGSGVEHCVRTAPCPDGYSMNTSSRRVMTADLQAFDGARR